MNANNIDWMKHLNSLTDYLQPQKRTRDFKQTTEMMARRGYRFTKQTIEIAEQLCAGRGLMLKGDVGVGKSFFFYAAGIPALSLELAMGRSLDELNHALNSWRDTDILIDDVGKGDGEIVSYGKRLQLLPYILESRMETDAVTHMTTNLTPDQLLNKYGARIVDRITQLCTMISIKGESMRSPDGARTKDWYEDFFRGRLWKICAEKCCHYDDAARRCLKGIENEPKSYYHQGYGTEPCCRSCALR